MKKKKRKKGLSKILEMSAYQRGVGGLGPRIMNDVNRPLIAKPSWGVLIVWYRSWFIILKAKFLRNTTYLKVKIPK